MSLIFSFKLVHTISTYYAVTLITSSTISLSLNQATGYASQHIWCLSQARIKWEGCSRKGIRHKDGGMMEVGR